MYYTELIDEDLTDIDALKNSDEHGGAKCFRDVVVSLIVVRSLS